MDAQGCDDVIDAQQQQVQRAILSNLREAHRPQPGTWQATITVYMRAGMVWNIYNAIRLARPDINDRDALQFAFANENERFVEVQNRDEYATSVKGLLGLLQAAHQQNIQAAQNAMNPGNNAANAQEGVVHQTPTHSSGSNQDQSVSK